MALLCPLPSFQRAALGGFPVLMSSRASAFLGLLVLMIPWTYFFLCYFSSWYLKKTGENLDASWPYCQLSSRIPVKDLVSCAVSSFCVLFSTLKSAQMHSGMSWLSLRGKDQDWVGGDTERKGKFWNPPLLDFPGDSPNFFMCLCGSGRLTPSKGARMGPATFAPLLPPVTSLAKGDAWQVPAVSSALVVTPRLCWLPTVPVLLCIALSFGTTRRAPHFKHKSLRWTPRNRFFWSDSIRFLFIGKDWRDEFEWGRGTVASGQSRDSVWINSEIFCLGKLFFIYLKAAHPFWCIWYLMMELLGQYICSKNSQSLISSHVNTD